MSSLALVLHAHLPFIRHPEHDDFLEEWWLYEAVVECYLPLLSIFHRLTSEGVPWRLTLTLSPPLCGMLRDPLLQSRTARHLDRLCELSLREVQRTAQQPEFAGTARFYRDRLESLRSDYHELWRGDLLGAFRQFQDAGSLEIITCGATHGFLPLMADEPAAVRAQLRLAVDDYRQCFGRAPRGIWLPECAYYDGLDAELAAAELRWFILDAHGVLLGTPRPRAAIFAPIFTPAGPAAFGRDREASRQVWSAEEGYPGDPRYREFYRDVGYELPAPETAPLIPEHGPRRFTSLKYHRVTGRRVALEHKQPYRRDEAMAAVQAHALHFLDSRRRQLETVRAALGREPIVVAPFDAELFGHWWFEGPDFLEAVLRGAALPESGLTLSTPGGYLARNATQQLVRPSASSWGQHGYAEVWAQPRNAWIYPHLRTAAKRMQQAALRHSVDCPAGSVLDRTLAQMARELLLAQSSDWAFLMKTETASEYATARTKQHLARFHALASSVEAGRPGGPTLTKAEWRDTLFPQLDWRVYAR